MRRTTSTLITLAIAVFFVDGVAGQSADPSARRTEALSKALEPLVNGEWHPWEREAAWLELRRELNDELTQRPLGQLAALVRRAAARVVVDITPVIAPRNDKLSVNVDVRSRFVLDVAIPYVAEIFGSLDGGEWFLLGAFREGRRCGTSLNATHAWPPTLEQGFHRLDVLTNIRFLTALSPPSESADCWIRRRGPKESLPTQDAENVIQHERRILSTQFFGISADLLGAPATLASALETGLPTVPIGQWLNALVASTPGPTPRSDGSWFAEWCAPEESFVFSAGEWHKEPHLTKRRPRAICMTFLASLGEERVLSLRLRVGTLDERAGSWSIEPPSVRELAIGGSGSVLDVPFLNMLPSLKSLSAGSLPAVDVSIQPGEIRYAPADAKPGDPITITATIRNLGERDAPRWNGMLSVISDSYIVLREFVGDVPAQGTMIVAFPTTMPVWGCVAINIEPLPANAMMRQGPYGHIRDVYLDNNNAAIEIGAPRPKALDAHCGR